MATLLYSRDQKTSSSTSGVWLKPGHWASVTVQDRGQLEMFDDGECIGLACMGAG